MTGGREEADDENGDQCKNLHATMFLSGETALGTIHRADFFNKLRFSGRIQGRTPTGTNRPVVVPSPSWPTALRPQHHTCFPLPSQAQVLS